MNDKIEYNQKKFNHLKKKYWANLGEGFIECKKHETLFKENGEFCQYCLDKTKKKGELMPLRCGRTHLSTDIALATQLKK